MAEYIDREAFLATKRKVYCEACDRRKNSKGKIVYDIGDAPCRACSIGDIFDDVEDFPAADVVERKHGKWERHFSRPCVYADLFWHCSVCGYKNAENFANTDHHFCPNCGADMRGGEDVDTD